MKNIPVYTNVECTDGPCGQSFAVVVDPTTRQVTHFALEDKSLGDPANRLVSVEHVLEASEDIIRLSCTKSQIAEGASGFVTRRSWSRNKTARHPLRTPGILTREKVVYWARSLAA